jgi:hypothetical protein
MANTSFNNVIKRTNQTGKINDPVFSPSSVTYRRAVLGCTIGSMNKCSTFYSFPILAFAFLNKQRQSN